jgi:hypothetical protein
MKNGRKPHDALNSSRLDRWIADAGAARTGSAAFERHAFVGSPSWPEYQRLYLAQAFWQLSDTSHFERWFQDERERILRAQSADGSWKGSRFGSAYTTAVNCLVLSLPDGVLPIFQR